MFDICCRIRTLSNLFDGKELFKEYFSKLRPCSFMSAVFTTFFGMNIIQAHPFRLDHLHQFIKRWLWMYTHGNFPYTNLHEIRVFCLLYPDIRVYHRWFQHPLGSCVLFTVLVLEHSCNLQFPPSLIISRNSSRWYSKIKVTLLFWNFKRTFIKQTCNISVGPILNAGQWKILFIVPQLYIWATAWQHQQNDLCAQRRLRSALASAQSDQSLRCPHEKTLGP